MIRENCKLFDILLDLVERLQPHILVAHPLRDVPTNDLHAHNEALLHDRRLVQFEERHRPVFAAELDLKPLDRFAPGDLLPSLLPDGEGRGGDIVLTPAADQFIGGIPEDAGHRRGDVGDPPVMVAGVDHIKTPLRNLAEPLLALPESVLHLPPVGDVLQHRDDQASLSGVVKQRRGQPPPDDPAVLRQVALLPADALPQDGLLVERTGLLPVGGVDQVVRPHTIQFVLIVAEHAHERRVRLHDPPVRVDERDPGARLLEDPPEPLFALPQGKFRLLLLGDLLTRDGQHSGPRPVDLQVVPPSGSRLLQPPLHRETGLCDLSVESTGTLADRREDIEESLPDQFFPAAVEYLGRFLVQLADTVIDRVPFVVPDNLVEGVTLEHPLKEKAVLLLAPPDILVRPHPLDDPAEPPGNGVDQAAFTDEKQRTVVFGPRVAVADLHPPGYPSLDDDRALLAPGALDKSGRPVFPAVDHDAGGGIFRMEPAGRKDDGNIAENLLDRVPRPLDDTAHGIQRRKFPHPVVQSDPLLPQHLFGPAPFRDVFRDDDEQVVLRPVHLQFVK